MRFVQSSYSQFENFSPLTVNLVLDASSGTAMQAIVVQITASSQGGDTATGEKTIRNYHHWNVSTGLTNLVSFLCVQLFALVCD